MSRGCAALIVAGLLVLFLALSCGGPSVRQPPVPVGVFVDSLIIVPSETIVMQGDTVQLCAFARLSTGQWGIAGGGDTLDACQDLYRQMWSTRVGLSRL